MTTVAVTFARGVTDPGKPKRFATVETLFDAIAELKHEVLPDDSESTDEHKMFEEAKRAGAGIIAATFTGRSKSVKALVKDSAACFLPFDLDALPGIDTQQGRQKLRALRQAMSRWESVAWTTASSRPEGIRLRWLVALDKPLPNHDKRAWRHAYTAAARVLGVESDYDENACDSVRWSLLPQVQEAHVDHAEVWRFSGAKLALDDLRAMGEVSGALTDAAQAAHVVQKRKLQDEESAAAALEKTVKTIAKAPVGQRNTTLNSAVFRLAVRFAHVLELEAVHEALEPALKKAGLFDDPTEHDAALSTIERAYQDGETQNSKYRESWAIQLTVDMRGNPASTLANLLTIVERHDELRGLFRWDERAKRVAVTEPPPWSEEESEKFPRPLLDADAVRFAEWARDTLDVSTIAAPTAHSAIVAAAQSDPYDPFRDWLDALEWDETERLDGWLSRHAGAEDNDLNTAMFSKWLISAVARTYRPGCQADYTLILEGEQGARKSSFLEVLAGSAYFQDSLPDLAHKDSKLACHGPVIIEFGELRNLTNKEVEHVKAFLTCRVDRVRPPYGREEVSYRRRCVFAGSTNDSVYLRDTTGNRRFWPVAVSRIDYAQAHRDRAQLWAEAVHRYHAGEAWWLDAALERAAEDEQGARRLRHPWEAKLLERFADVPLLEAMDKAGRFEPGQFCDGRLHWLSGQQALMLVDVMQPKMQDSQQMAKVLDAVGWHRAKKMIGGARGWRYFPLKGAKKGREE